MLTCVSIYSHKPYPSHLINSLYIGEKEKRTVSISFRFVSFHFRFHSGFYNMPCVSALKATYVK